MTKLCKFCKSEILKATPHQQYCGPACKAAAAMVRRIKAADDAEGQRRAATVWATRRSKNLVKSVCLYCLGMEWTPKHYEFCSIGCRTLHGGPEDATIKQ